MNHDVDPDSFPRVHAHIPTAHVILGGLGKGVIFSGTSTVVHLAGIKESEQRVDVH
jgi:hypothetical protein